MPPRTQKWLYALLTPEFGHNSTIGMNGEYPYNETDPLMDELKAAAFEYLLLNPGSEFGDWYKGLIEQYPAEVVDALGNNPHEVYSDLAELWNCEYTDPKTGLYQDFKYWARTFSNEEAVGIYYHLVDACEKLHRMGAKFP